MADPRTTGIQYGPLDASVEGSVPNWLANRSAGLANAVVGKLTGDTHSFGELYNQGMEQKAQLREHLAQQNPNATAAGQGGRAALLMATAGKMGQGGARQQGYGSTYTPNAPVAGAAGQTGLPGAGMSAMPAAAPVAGGAVPLSQGLATSNILRGGLAAGTAAGGAAVRGGLGALQYGTLPAVGLASFIAANGMPGSTPQDNGKYNGFDQGPTGKFTTSPTRAVSYDDASAMMAQRAGGAGAGQGGAGAQAGAMFPGDDPSASLRVRMMLAKLSPRPHYATAADRAGALAMRLAQERYDRAIQRAGGDQKMMDEAEDNRLAAVSGVAKAGGVWGQMGLAAPQPQQDDGWLW